jgi:hypothetical protein
MASRDAAETRQRSGPIEQLGDEERRQLVDSMAQELPRIEIDEALEKGWFEIWYQPKIDLKRNASRAPKPRRASGTRPSACCFPALSCLV